MALRYQKPPLVEALCEVRFASTEERRWDWAIPGMLYERIRDRFPIRRERHAIDRPIVGPVTSGPATYSVERLQFVSADESTIVQVGPDLLAANSLRPHLGWPDLRDTLLSVLAAYRGIASPPGIPMAAVRYINQVEIPLQSGFALEKYFAVRPGLPTGVPAAVSTFLIHTEVGYEDPAARSAPSSPVYARQARRPSSTTTSRRSMLVGQAPQGMRVSKGSTVPRVSPRSHGGLGCRRSPCVRAGADRLMR